MAGGWHRRRALDGQGLAQLEGSAPAPNSRGRRECAAHFISAACRERRLRAQDMAFTWSGRCGIEPWRFNSAHQPGWPRPMGRRTPCLDRSLLLRAGNIDRPLTHFAAAKPKPGSGPAPNAGLERLVVTRGQRPGVQPAAGLSSKTPTGGVREHQPGMAVPPAAKSGRSTSWRCTKR